MSDYFEELVRSIVTLRRSTSARAYVNPRIPAQHVQTWYNSPTSSAIALPDLLPNTTPFRTRGLPSHSGYIGSGISHNFPMISASRRWLRRNRTNFAIGAGVLGAGYLAGQYVLGKIGEARQRMSEERIAKEKYDISKGFCY